MIILQSPDSKNIIKAKSLTPFMDGRHVVSNLLRKTFHAEGTYQVSSSDDNVSPNTKWPGNGDP